MKLALQPTTQEGASVHDFVVNSANSILYDEHDERHVKPEMSINVSMIL